MATTKELPVMAFASASAWEAWLAAHHAELGGVWLKIAKKASGIPSVTHDEALDVALCYGWIDGHNETPMTIPTFCKSLPRRARSLWSKRNIDKVTQLTARGEMQPSGLAEVEAAKQDGRWAAAYESSRNMTVPADFLKALEKDKKALAFFHTLNKANTYAIAFRLTTAKKPETRKRRFENLLAMLKRGDKIY